MEVETIEIVADFLAADQGQHLIGSSVPEVETPAQFEIAFHREEPKGAVMDPFDLGFLTTPQNNRAMEFGLHISDRLDVEPRAEGGQGEGPPLCVIGAQSQ